jgi:AcrR family transcriptional regulator
MENREKILNCALELFHDRGYDAVGVQEIAERAGVTKPTLYYYFGNKKGLLEALLYQEYDVFREAVFQAADEREQIWNVLPKIASAYLDYGMKHGKAYRLMMAMFYSAKENEAYQVVRPIVEDFYGRMVRVFAGASSQLGNMNGRQQQFALGLTGMLDHYLLLMASREPDGYEIPEEVKQGLARQFMHGIFS